MKCPVCGGSAAPLYTIHRFDPPLEILRCPACRLQMQASPPADPDEFYDEAYYTGRAEYSYRDERGKIPFDRYVWRARLKNIARFTPPPGDFLDAGCAFGGFVEEAARFGYRATGLDVSPFAVNAGRARKLDLRVGRLEPGVFPDHRFDVVTLIEVFEHIDSPREACETLARIIRPGGLCVIQTADFDGLQARHAGSDYHYYLPGHLYYYSASNLSSLLKQCGFSSIRIFRPVDFGLLPKLLKSRGDFQHPLHYLKWFRTSLYHLRGMLAFKNFALTSSMVLYAIRD